MTGLESIPCPLCGGLQHRFVYERPDHRLQVDGRRFRVVRCRDCGLGFVNPRPTATEIHRYYPEEFYGADETPEQALAQQRERLDAMARWLEHLPPGRLLDVGCYKGEFMHWMAQRGWSVRGVEFSARPPNLFGLDIHYGDVGELPARAAFDVVTLWAVLEHVFDPRGVLTECRRRMRRGGRIFVLVPNFRSVPARFMQHDDVPRHLLMFTPEALRRLLRETGFETLRCVCEQSVYSGSVRGLLNYVVKRIAGERFEDVVAQNRGPDRWHEFSSTLNGRESAFMRRVDTLDIRIAPWLDRWLDTMGLGFIMVAEAAAR